MQENYLLTCLQGFLVLVIFNPLCQWHQIINVKGLFLRQWLIQEDVTDWKFLESWVNDAFTWCPFHFLPLSSAIVYQEFIFLRKRFCIMSVPHRHLQEVYYQPVHSVFGLYQAIQGFISEKGIFVSHVDLVHNNVAALVIRFNSVAMCHIADARTIPVAWCAQRDVRDVNYCEPAFTLVKSLSWLWTITNSSFRPCSFYACPLHICQNCVLCKSGLMLSLNLAR